MASTLDAKIGPGEVHQHDNTIIIKINGKSYLKRYSTVEDADDAFERLLAFAMYKLYGVEDGV